MNPTLYQLAANSSTYASAFHDVTSGNNNCIAGPTFLQRHHRVLGDYRLRRSDRSGLD